MYKPRHHLIPPLSRRVRALWILGFAVICCLLLFATTRLMMQGPQVEYPPSASFKHFARQRTHYSLPNTAMHLTIILHGAATLRRFGIHLKSVLANWKSRGSTTLHYHVVTTNAWMPVLRDFTQSWNPIFVKFHLYAWEVVEHRIGRSQLEKIGSLHYSGLMSLTRLFLPELLPSDVEKVISVDADMLFLGDIAELWNEFNYFKRDQLYGMVEEENDVTSNWPNDGRLFNGGLIMMNLEAMRRDNWFDFWNIPAQKYLRQFGTPKFGEQCVLNSALVGRRERCFVVPCQWNKMYGGYSDNDFCITGWEEGMTPPKVLHYNKESKPDLPMDLLEWVGLTRANERGVNTVTLRTMFVHAHHLYDTLNGNTFCSPRPSYSALAWHPCQDDSVALGEWVGFKGVSSQCTSFLLDQYLVRRKHPFYLEGSPKTARTGDISMCLALPFDRLGDLTLVAEKWLGPISVALYLSDDKTWLVRHAFKSVALLNLRRNIDVHLIYEAGAALLNLAIQYAKSDLVIPLPPKTFLDRLLKPLRQQEYKAAHNEVLLIPISTPAGQQLEDASQLDTLQIKPGIFPAVPIIDKTSHFVQLPTPNVYLDERFTQSHNTIRSLIYRFRAQKLSLSVKNIIPLSHDEMVPKSFQERLIDQLPDVGSCEQKLWLASTNFVNCLNKSGHI